MVRPVDAASSASYPINLNLSGRICVVIGGGAVAERKVMPLLSAGAAVLIVSPSLTTGLAELAAAGSVQWLESGYATGVTDGAALVFAATDDPEVNAHAAADARSRGAWVNVADAPDACDFTVPATVRLGDVVISVTSGVPGYSAAIADRVAAEIGPEYGELCRLLRDARRRIMAGTAGIAARREAMAALVAQTDNLVELLHRGENEAARAVIERGLMRSERTASEQGL